MHPQVYRSQAHTVSWASRTWYKVQWGVGHRGIKKVGPVIVSPFQRILLLSSLLIKGERKVRVHGGGPLVSRIEQHPLLPNKN